MCRIYETKAGQGDRLCLRYANGGGEELRFDSEKCDEVARVGVQAASVRHLTRDGLGARPSAYSSQYDRVRMTKPRAGSSPSRAGAGE